MERRKNAEDLLKWKKMLDAEENRVYKLEKKALKCESYYNHALRQVANLFNKEILCVQRHATMFVQVYANTFIGERIMNIEKWEVRRNVHYTYNCHC